MIQSNIMNQEEQDKIYQLIQTEDINNWELAYQLIRGLYGRDKANYIISLFLKAYYTNTSNYSSGLTHRKMLDTLTAKIYNFNLLKKCIINNP